jgi:hypothetical protein
VTMGERPIGRIMGWFRPFRRDNIIVAPGFIQGIKKPINLRPVGGMVWKDVRRLGNLLDFGMHWGLTYPGGPGGPGRHSQRGRWERALNRTRMGFTIGSPPARG